MGGNAFLVTGNEKADRAGQLGSLCAGGNEARNRTLHVDRAAAMQQRAAHFGGEGIAGPALARRYDVEMAGKGDVAAGAIVAQRDQIFDRAVCAFAGDEAVDRKAQRFQRGLQRIEHRAGGGGDGGASDQLLGEGDGIGHVRGSAHAPAIAKDARLCQRSQHAQD